jgi:hypothetical protein
MAIVVAMALPGVCELDVIALSTLLPRLTGPTGDVLVAIGGSTLDAHGSSL